MKGEQISGVRDTLELAFQSCDTTIKERVPQHLSILRRSAKWHKDSATEKQMATIRKLYRGQSVPENLSKGDAAKLIGQKVATFQKKDVSTTSTSSTQ